MDGKHYMVKKFLEVVYITFEFPLNRQPNQNRDIFQDFTRALRESNSTEIRLIVPQDLLQT